MLRAFAEGAIFGEAFGPDEVRVVWLHGWARRASDFTRAAHQLAGETVGSVALELPGFGATPPLASPGGSRAYAALLAAQLAAIAPDPVVLVGHSFGGTVALGVADLVPERVAALVLVASPLVRTPGPRPPRRFRAARRLHQIGVVSDARMEALRQRRGSADYRSAAPEMRRVLVAALAESMEPELARWRGRTSLLWGELDHDVPVAVARAAAACLPTPPELVVLPGVGHLVPTVAPEDLAATVAALL